MILINVHMYDTYICKCSLSTCKQEGRQGVWNQGNRRTAVITWMLSHEALTTMQQHS